MECLQRYCKVFLSLDGKIVKVFQNHEALKPRSLERIDYVIYVRHVEFEFGLVRSGFPANLTLDFRKGH